MRIAVAFDCTATAKTVRILLVDDAESVRRALRHVLDSEPGLAVIGETGDGEHAVALAAALRPDIVLLDLILPGMNGIEAARRIHTAGAAGDVVMLTAMSGDRVRAAALDAGIALFIEKGDDLDHLVERIRTLHQRNIPRERTAPKNGRSPMIADVCDTPNDPPPLFIAFGSGNQ
jgi:DNA-binding NarL/FixJ family response regulator